MKKLFVALLAVSVLGGCQSIFGQRAKLEVRPAGSEQTPQGAAIALEDGKQFLRSGAVGSAIAALQMAATDRASAPEAHNALGVAYAMLGRGDLAERFFRQAIEANPAEPKYAANLAKYYQSSEAALARRPVVAPPAPAPADREPESELAAANEAFDRIVGVREGTVRVATPPPASSVTRVSATEIAIRTMPAAPVGLASAARRGKPRQVAVADPAAPGEYPVRIYIGQPRGN